MVLGFGSSHEIFQDISRQTEPFLKGSLPLDQSQELDELKPWPVEAVHLWKRM
mgnify:FL=1